MDPTGGDITIQATTVGQGGFGTVKLGVQRDPETGSERSVALKQMRHQEWPQSLPTFLRELAALQTLRHPGVVDVIGAQVIGGSLYIVLPHFPRGDLSAVMTARRDAEKPFGVEETCARARELFEAVAYCHGRQVVHRDLKPQNILVADDGSLRICDFGLVRARSRTLRTLTLEVVTIWYRAPELLLGCVDYGEGVDIWALGLVVAEFATLRPLVHASSQIETIFKIFRLFGTPTEEAWPAIRTLPHFSSEFPQWHPLDLARTYDDMHDDVASLVCACTRYDPARRTSAAAALASERLLTARSRAADENVSPPGR